MREMSDGLLFLCRSIMRAMPDIETVFRIWLCTTSASVLFSTRLKICYIYFLDMLNAAACNCHTETYSNFIQNDLLNILYCAINNEIRAIISQRKYFSDYLFFKMLSMATTHLFYVTYTFFL